jgi:hypothetical protein
MEVLQLMKDETLKASLGQNCKQMAITGSASKIVDEIFKQGSPGDRSE